MFPQTSQNSPNHAKQAHTWQRRYRRHDDVALKVVAWRFCLTWFLREMTVSFLQISRKLKIQSWNWLYFRKANKKTYGNTPVEYISVKNTPFKPMVPKNPQTSPSSWGTWIPSNELTPFTTPNGIRIQSAVLPQYTFRTDRPTGESSIPVPLTLYCIDRERRTKKVADLLYL